MNTGNAGKTGMGSCVGLQINRADCGKSGTPNQKTVFLVFSVFPVCAAPSRPHATAGITKKFQKNSKKIFIRLVNFNNRGILIEQQDVVTCFL